MDKDKTNGGINSRVGQKFHKEIEAIKDSRLKNGNSKDRVATEKISNLIVRHHKWPEIREHIIEATNEEVEKHGLE